MNDTDQLYFSNAICIISSILLLRVWFYWFAKVLFWIGQNSICHVCGNCFFFFFPVRVFIFLYMNFASYLPTFPLKASEIYGLPRKLFSTLRFFKKSVLLLLCFPFLLLNLWSIQDIFKNRPQSYSKINSSTFYIKWCVSFSLN